MNNSVHVDYQEIMSKKTVNFYDLYETAICKIENEFEISKEIQVRLQEKRTFGFNKYGEHSVQGYFTNAMTTPIYNHLEEEIIDSINYVLHIRFQVVFSDCEVEDAQSHQILSTLLSLYDQIQGLKQIAS